MFERIVVATFALPLAAAWGADGHGAIAALGSDYFTENTKRLVTEIMGEGVSIADHASWADTILHGPDSDMWKWSSHLHYVNVDDCEFVYARDCNNDGCSAGAILNYTRQVVDETLPIERRQEALKFVTHFMGDIHQPLHNGAKIDLDGNTIKVQMDFANKPFGALHKAWDEKMIDQYQSERYPGDYVQGDFDYDLDRTPYWTITKDQLAKELQQDGKYYNQISEWTSDCEEHGLEVCIYNILREHVALACSKAYKHIDGSKILNNDALPFGYYEDRINTVMEALAKAAVRYAWVMNNAFPDTDLECDDYCDSVLPGSYCKYWQTIPVCQGNDIPCSCSMRPISVGAY